MKSIDTVWRLKSGVATLLMSELKRIGVFCLYHLLYIARIMGLEYPCIQVKLVQVVLIGLINCFSGREANSMESWSRTSKSIHPSLSTRSSSSFGFIYDLYAKQVWIALQMNEALLFKRDSFPFRR